MLLGVLNRTAIQGTMLSLQQSLDGGSFRKEDAAPHSPQSQNEMKQKKKKWFQNVSREAKKGGLRKRGSQLDVLETRSSGP